jgi:putative endonuclease
MYYVYLIQSLSAARERYVGITSDLEQRLREHNAGKSSYTSKFKSWKLTAYVAFTDRAKAEAFERYLKSGSGHAFARKPAMVTKCQKILHTLFASLKRPFENTFRNFPSVVRTLACLQFFRK